MLILCFSLKVQTESILGFVRARGILYLCVHTDVCSRGGALVSRHLQLLLALSQASVMCLISINMHQLREHFSD